MTSDTEIPTRQQQFAHGIIGDDLSFLMARANALSLSAANVGLAPHQLRARSYSVLAMACDDLRPSQKEIAEYLRLDPSQVVTLIDDLEQRGLVQREADPRDRRSKVLVATREGHTAHARARADIVRVDEERLSGLSAEERDIFGKVLRRLAFPSE